jgi:outer membrane protein TolC
VDESPREQVVGVKQNVSFLWSQAPSISANGAAYHAGVENFTERKREVIVETLRAAFRFAEAQRLGEIMDTVLARTALVTETVRARLHVADISAYDAERFELIQVELLNRRQQLFTEESAALSELVGLSGIPADVWNESDLTIDLDVPPMNLDSALSFAQEHRPLLRAADLGVTAGKRSVRAARMAQIPELSLGGGQKTIEDGPSGYVLEGELEIPLFGQHRSQVRLASAQRKRAEIQLAEATARVRHEVESAVRHWNFLTTINPNSMNKADSATANMDRGITLYIQGEVGAFELVDALRVGVETWQSTLELQHARITAAAEFRRAVGLEILPN